MEDQSLLLSYVDGNGQQWGQHMFKDNETKYTVKDLPALNNGDIAVYAEVLYGDDDKPKVTLVLPRCPGTNTIIVTAELKKFI